MEEARKSADMHEPLILYRLLRTSVQEISTSRTISSSFTACTRVLATWVICSQNRHLQHDLTSLPPCRET